MTRLSDGAIRALTNIQREMLISHIDGAVLIIRADYNKVLRALVLRGLLRPSSPQTTRPRATILTDEGRRALGVILGDYADALVRAGLLEQENPMQVLRRLQAARTPHLQPVPAEPATLDEKSA